MNDADRTVFHQQQGFFSQNVAWVTPNIMCTNAIINTIGPLIIEALWAKRVSTGALGDLVGALVVQTKI